MKKFTLRRQLKAPLLPVDDGDHGYVVRFARVREGCLFKHEVDWFIKRSEETAVLNGTYTERHFHPGSGVWITTIDSVKPVANGRLEDV